MSLTVKIINLVFFLLTLAANYVTLQGFGSFKPISNVSQECDSLITPPNWTFSIWGLIYTWLLIFCITQFIPSLKLEKSVEKINYIFIISCLFNIAWIVCFSLGTKTTIIISVFLIFGLLGCLITIQQKCQFFTNNVTVSNVLCIGIPFSLYLGWIMSASIVNVACCVNSWTTVQNPEWGYYALLVIAAILYSINLFKENNYVTMLVFIYVSISLMFKYMGNNKPLSDFTIGLLYFSIFVIVVKITLQVICKNINNAKKTHLYKPTNLTEFNTQSDKLLSA